METIKITRGDVVLAEQTTDHPRSSYGQPVWSIEVAEPSPGPCAWSMGDKNFALDIIGVRDGWLICRQPGGLLVGVVWSDGSYFADLIVDANDNPVSEILDGCRIRGTVFTGAGLGSVLG